MNIFHHPDVERLNNWADLLEKYGPDVSHWGSLPFIIAEMCQIGARIGADTSDDAIPLWNDSMSDGCSVPFGLQNVFFTPEQRTCCVAHDSRYYVGGSAKNKLEADLAFRDCLIAKGMEVGAANTMFAAVVTGGQPELRMKGVSWAFGGERFVYSALPARMK